MNSTVSSETSAPPPEQGLLPRALVGLLSLPILAWRATAAVRSPRCRFYPSCSAYALDALRLHGPFRGAWLAARRLLRCHPWNPGGVDHVPKEPSS